MTEQENRFLEKLGITPGPWETTCFSDIIASDMSGKICRIESDRTVSEDKSNCKLMACAPDMFLSLWNNIFFISKLDELFYNKLKSKLWSESFKLLSENIKIIESSTGKTFEQLLEIWESCA